MCGVWCSTAVVHTKEDRLLWRCKWPGTTHSHLFNPCVHITRRGADRREKEGMAIGYMCCYVQLLWYFRWTSQRHCTCCSLERCSDLSTMDSSMSLPHQSQQQQKLSMVLSWNELYYSISKKAFLCCSGADFCSWTPTPLHIFIFSLTAHTWLDKVGFSQWRAAAF